MGGAAMGSGRRRPRAGAVVAPGKAWWRLVIPVAGQPSEVSMFDVNSQERRALLGISLVVRTSRQT